MEFTEQQTEQRRFKRRKCHKRPIAVLGPDPIRVGHITVISDDTVEIQFREPNGRNAILFNELSVLIPEHKNLFLSGKLEVETVSCNRVENKNSQFHVPMRKCIISLNKLNSSQKRQLKGACL